MIYTDFKTPYGSYKVSSLQTAKYRNGRISLTLIDTSEGYPEPIATATVNLPDVEMEKGEAAIKDYSENEGMLEWLLENGIVEKPHRYVQSGYVRVPIVKIK